MENTIGLYDSGLGGYEVYRYLKKMNPNLNMILYADNGNAPFGNKTHDELLKYGIKAMQFFETKGVKDVVIACNTVSATIIDDLKKVFPELNIKGIIELTAQSVDESYDTVTVLATPNTANSHAYKNAMINAHIEEIGMETLASDIENKESNEVIEYYLKPILEACKSVALVLGCTHYPIIYSLIETYFKGDIYDSNIPIYVWVDHAKFSSDTAVQEVYTSGDVEAFKNKIKNVFDIDEEVQGI